MRKVKLVLMAILGLVILLSPFVEVMAQGGSHSPPSPAPPPPPPDLWWLIAYLAGLIL